VNFYALGALVFLASMHSVACADSEKDEAPTRLDRVICKNLPVSGSHRKQRICRTKLEWDESRKRSREDARYEKHSKRATRREAS
jgi:hypothetical protein